MYFQLSQTAVLLALATTQILASPADLLNPRTTCTTPEGSGTCLSTSSCDGFSVTNHCPGAANIQCCVKKTCFNSQGNGICQNASKTCSGSYASGLCPSDSSIKCCIASGPAPPPGGSGGASIVANAVKEEGLPYVWGGGGCAGPSKGGFDCSGLTQFAVCQAGHGTIPRTAATQYASSLGHHLPRGEAEAGDLLFWSDGGDCAGGRDVEHVGIFMRAGWMVNAAHTGTPVREQAIWTSSGGETICPDAVRFW